MALPERIASSIKKAATTAAQAFTPPIVSDVASIAGKAAMTAGKALVTPGVEAPTPQGPERYTFSGGRLQSTGQYSAPQMPQPNITGMSPVEFATQSIAEPYVKNLPAPFRIAAEELTRPINYAAMSGLGAAKSVGGSLGARALTTATEPLTERIDNPYVRALTETGIGLGGFAAGAGIAGNAGKIARGYRDITKDIPVGFSIKETPDETPIDKLKNVLDEELKIRQSGTAAEEIAKGRSRQAASYSERLALGQQQGLSGEELSQYARSGLSGRLRETLPSPVPLSGSDRSNLFNMITDAFNGGVIGEYEHANATAALGKALDGVSLQPGERNLLARLFGGDITEKLSERATQVTSRSALNTPPRGPQPLASLGRKGVPGRAEAAAKAGRLASKRDDEIARQAAKDIAEQRKNIPKPLTSIDIEPTSRPPSASQAAREARQRPIQAQAAAEREAARALEKQRAFAQRNVPRGPVDWGDEFSSSAPPSVKKAAAAARDRAAKRLGVQEKRQPTAFEKTMDILNIPRSLKSSFDLSAPFRQGSVLGVRNPDEFWGAWSPMVKSLGSEDVAQAVDREIKAGKMGIIKQRAGLYIAPLDEAAISTREEAIASRLAAKIPGIGQSQRAYVTYLNKLRSDVFDKNYTRLAESGMSGKELEDASTELAKFINWSTGRGEISGGELAYTLTNLFFSPRLLKSRFDIIRSTLPTTLGGNIKNDAVREIARENVLMWASANAAALGVISVAGAFIGGNIVDVELDPRSSDWGKIRIGATRIDPWAGFQQIGRAGAQVVTGERKGTYSGTIEEIGRMKPLLDFLRSKASPQLSVAVDQLMGETQIGKSVRTPLERAENIGRQFIPLAPEGISEGILEGGKGAGIPGAAIGGAVGALGALGFGSQSYGAAQEKGARGEIGDLKGEDAFNAINAQSWWRTVNRAPEQIKSGIKDYKSFDEWEAAAFDAIYTRALEQIGDEMIARNEARKALMQLPVYKEYKNNQRGYKDWFVKNNPDVAFEKQSEADREGRNLFTDEQKAIIAASRSR